MIVVAVVITIYTAGAMSGVAGGFLQTMAAGASALGGGVAVGGVTAAAAGFTGGAIAAAAGSVASQLVGNAIGAQDGFNWRAVGMAAIGGAASSGMAGLGQASSVGSAINGSSWSAVAARAALSNTITQGVGNLTGLQKGFSWASVAASYAGAAVGTQVGDYLQENSVFGSLLEQNSAGIARATVSGIAAGLTTAAARGGKIAVTQIATDAFGNALGSSLASMASQSGGQDSGGATMSRRQAERAEYGVSLNEVLGGEKNYLGMLGGYNGDSPSGQAGGSWDSTVAAWRADNPTYQVLPQVEISGRRETAEYQLNVAFGLDKKVTFSDANPSRIEAQPSIWSSYANIAGAYRHGQIGLGDAAAMAWDNTKFAYQGSQRTQGAVQAFNGGLEVAGAFAISGTGVGAVVGVPLAFHGGDNFGTGMRRLLTGEMQNTVTYNSVEALTGSRNAAAFVDNAIPFAGAVAGTPSLLVRTSSMEAAAIHPGQLAAESADVSQESLLRALRQAATPESLATAKLISRGNLDVNILAADPSGRGLGGLYRFGTNQIDIYGNAFSTPIEAAGFATHETTHFMQRLTSANYNLGHEFDAFRAQGAVDLGHWTNSLGDQGLYDLLRNHDVYRGVRPDPTWPR